MQRCTAAAVVSSGLQQWHGGGWAVAAAVVVRQRRVVAEVLDCSSAALWNQVPATKADSEDLTCTVRGAYSSLSSCVRGINLLPVPCWPMGGPSDMLGAARSATLPSSSDDAPCLTPSRCGAIKASEPTARHARTIDRMVARGLPIGGAGAGAGADAEGNLAGPWLQ